ncbi:hypothetical protein CJU89_2711 [Yarrowia sp. B02]|nr:hypothetical protein CJU89_2711 [Yarrowia sp. B02]
MALARTPLRLLRFRALHSSAAAAQANRSHLDRLANFGATVSRLEELVPSILQNTLPHEMLSNSVCLKFYFGQARDMNYSDEHQLFGYSEGDSGEDFVREVGKRQKSDDSDDSGPLRISMPHARGKPAYATCWKVLQWVATSYVRADTQIQITKMTLHPPQNDDSSSNGRIIVKWTTVDSDADHWGGGGGLGAAFYCSETDLKPVPVHVNGEEHTVRFPREEHTVRFAGEEHMVRFAPTTQKDHPISSYIPRIGLTFGKMLDPGPSEHILSGIFIFDLTENCDLIQTHIVDNVEVMKEKEAREAFKLA